MTTQAPRLFEIYRTGDPYSSHWEASEFKDSFDEDICVYRGDLPHLSKTRLIAHLRRLYPGCKIRDRKW